MDLYFTHIYEHARHRLNLSRDEYALANYIDQWANFPRNPFRGWCNQTLNQKAAFIGITQRGVTKMQNKLIVLELVEKDTITSRTRTTIRWFDAVTAAKGTEQSSAPWKIGTEQSSARTRNNVPSDAEQSSADTRNFVPPHSNVFVLNEKNEMVMNDDAVVLVQPVDAVVNCLNQFLKPARPFNPKTKSTIEAVNARIREKYTVDEICLVIEYKTAEWLNDAIMEQYLRPSTLFGTGKFESYLVNASKWQQNGKPSLKTKKGHANNTTSGEFTSGAFV